MPEFFVAGLDGCRAGWVMVTWAGNHDVAPQATVIPHITAALATAARIIAVDMPIGLPHQSERQCERLARQRLGPRRSSVFAVPCRAAVEAPDYLSGCAANLDLTGKKFSKQSFMLFPKMREIDQTIMPADQDRVFEVHPEVSFWAMNTQIPLDHYKKTPDGKALRRDLLERSGFPVARLQHPPWKKSAVADDDIIDACACAWSAFRIATAQHLSLPSEPELDARGLRMQISA
jgi:predicted RNase H-like nuclease